MEFQYRHREKWKGSNHVSLMLHQSAQALRGVRKWQNLGSHLGVVVCQQEINEAIFHQELPSTRPEVAPGISLSF